MTEHPESELRKAMLALYLEVPRAVADDVKARGEAVIDALKAANAKLARVETVAANCEAIMFPHPHGPRYVIACQEAATAIRKALADA